MVEMRLLFSFLLALFSLYARINAQQFNEEHVTSFFNSHVGTSSGHTNNWAVLVCASRYWFNYRHMANALGMYRTVKRLGIPDSNIILMVADDAACNSRNKFPGCVYPAAARDLDLYGDNIEVDYRGYEVTVENFIRVLTGRMDSSVPRSKRLLSDDRSNVFVYMTGHGGNEFLKFQDNEEISAFDIADAFEQMWQKKRYNEIFFMIDTCQANTMYSKFYSPNILATGSSKLDENSYSYENDMDLGISVIDRFTHYVLRFMESVNKTSQATMQDLFDMYDPDKFASHAGVRSDLFNRPIDQTLITDFFGGVSQAEVLAPEEEFYYSSTPEGSHQQESENFTHVDSATTSGAVKSNNDEIHGYSDLLSVVKDLQRQPPKRDATGSFRTWVSSGLMFALVAWVSMRK